LRPVVQPPGRGGLVSGDRWWLASLCRALDEIVPGLGPRTKEACERLEMACTPDGDGHRSNLRPMEGGKSSPELTPTESDASRRMQRGQQRDRQPDHQ